MKVLVAFACPECYNHEMGKGPRTRPGGLPFIKQIHLRKILSSLRITPV